MLLCFAPPCHLLHVLVYNFFCMHRLEAAEKEIMVVIDDPCRQGVKRRNDKWISL